MRDVELSLGPSPSLADFVRFRCAGEPLGRAAPPPPPSLSLPSLPSFLRSSLPVPFPWLRRQLRPDAARSDRGAGLSVRRRRRLRGGRRGEPLGAAFSPFAQPARHAEGPGFTVAAPAATRSPFQPAAARQRAAPLLHTRGQGAGHSGGRCGQGFGSGGAEPGSP